MRRTLLLVFFSIPFFCNSQNTDWYRFNSAGHEANASTVGENHSLIGLNYYLGNARTESLVNDDQEELRTNTYSLFFQHGISDRLDFFVSGYFGDGFSKSEISNSKFNRDTKRLAFGGKYTIYNGKKWIPSIGLRAGYGLHQTDNDQAPHEDNYDFFDLGVHLTSRISERMLLTINLSYGFAVQVEYKLLDKLSFRGGYMDYLGGTMYSIPIDNMFFLAGSFWLNENLNLSLSGSKNLFKTYEPNSSKSQEYKGMILNTRVAWRINWTK